MTCWSTDEAWDITLALVVLQMGGWCVVSERMLVSMLSVFVDLCEMSRAVAALAPLCWHLKAEDLISPFLLMWVFSRSLNCLEFSSFPLAFPLEPGQTWTGCYFLRESFRIRIKFCTLSLTGCCTGTPVSEPILPGLVRKVLTGLVVKLLMNLDRITTASSSESVKLLFVICAFFRLECA